MVKIPPEVVRKKSICCGQNRSIDRFATMVFSKRQYEFGKMPEIGSNLTICNLAKVTTGIWPVTPPGLIDLFSIFVL